MIPKDCKRLIEVDFPIADVSKHASREKSIRHGHPSTLHLWWARRPLASSRAVLLALLWPDPCDPKCPEAFKAAAREMLPKVQGVPGPTDKDLQRALLKFVGDSANWDLATNALYLGVVRELVSAAYGSDRPLVADSFAGGGAIPLETLRVGADAFANDLNPIPYLLCRFLLEDVPRYRADLVAAMEEAAQALREHMDEKLRPLYAAASQDEEPTAYVWARTVTCEEPSCGAEIPLLRSMWLSRGKKSKWALRISVEQGQAVPRVVVEVFSPKEDEDVGSGTVVGGRAVCPVPDCSKAMSRSRIEAQLKQRRGGTESARLVAVMIATEERRKFRAPAATDVHALKRAKKLDDELRVGAFEDGVPVYPNEKINPIRPSPNARGLSAVTRYGMETFSDCYLPRQRLALAEMVRFIRTYDPSASSLDGAVGRFLLVVLGRCVDRWSSCSRLDSTRDTVTGSFSKQALQLVWDFCEANPFSEWSGGLANAMDWVKRAVAHAEASLPRPASVYQGDASELPLPDQSVDVWFTDPPYYDSVPYADLADFFFCWLRRANPSDKAFRDSFDPSNELTPKVQECVWNQSYESDGKVKDPAFFERCVSSAFGEGRRTLTSDGIGCVVFAHKSTEGWEALLSGMIQAGLSISASWPIQTEMKSRTAARDAASLMGSVHLVCRPREPGAPVGDWSEVLRQLPSRVSSWMKRLQDEGVRGADLLFACIGPALESFSSFSRVEMADGREVTLATFLEKVWEVVGRTALAQVLGNAEAGVGDGAGALEEDARLTALFLWTIQSTNGEHVADVAYEVDVGPAEIEDEEEEEEASTRKAKGFTLIFDVVRRFAQPLGIGLPEWEGRIIKTNKGIVRLLPIAERAKQLFGDEGAQAVATRLEREAANTNPLQGMLFPDADLAPKVRGRGRGRRKAAEVSDTTLGTTREATTLDRVHAAMLLQAAGRTNALRALLKSEQERGPDFLRLANSLSALYPKSSEEKRLLDAMLLAVPR